MPSIFESPSRGPRTFVEMSAAQLVAIGAGYYGFLCAPVRITEYAIKNTIDCKLKIFLQNPEDPNNTKWPWMIMDTNESFSMQSQMVPQIYIPAGTWIWVQIESGVPTSGELSLFYWGS